MLKIPVVDKGMQRGYYYSFIIGGSKFTGDNDAEFESYECAKLPKQLWTSIEDMEFFANRAKKQGATKIVVRGGTNNVGVKPETLIKVLNRLSLILPVELISLTPVRATINKYIKNNTNVSIIRCLDGDIYKGSERICQD